jgi:hypothetical protein
VTRWPAAVSRSPGPARTKDIFHRASYGGGFELGSARSKGITTPLWLMWLLRKAADQSLIIAESAIPCAATRPRSQEF